MQLRPDAEHGTALRPTAVRGDENGTAETQDTRQSFGRFAAPKYWPAWGAWLWMRTSALLPLRWAIAIHEAIGAAMHRFPTRARRIALRNLELCFPELSDDERWQISKAHFRALAAAFAECAAAWFASDPRLAGHFELVGLEHVEAALKRGKGVILYTGHFTGLEICGRPLKASIPRFACMFSHRSNALLDEIQRRGRRRCAHEAIPSDRVRALLGSLGRNAAVWYAPDRQSSLGNAELIPFFGHPAMTKTATSRIARISGAALIPFSYVRFPGTANYRLTFEPALENFPTNDIIADTRRLVAILERYVRNCPQQYLWTHKKFGGRPGLPDPYSSEPAPEPAAPEPAGPEPEDSITQEPPLPQLSADTGGPDLETQDPALRSRQAPAARAVETQAGPASSPAGDAAEAKFSVVIPLNNEATNVKPLLSELCAVLAELEPYELVVVDDGSTDSTNAELHRFAATGRSLRLLTHAARRGQSTAIYNGIKAATADIVVVLDGDLQNDPADIERLLEHYRADPDRDNLGLVIGHRVNRRDSGLRRLSSRVANSVRARVLHDDTPDTGCGLKLINRSIFMQLPSFDHMHRFLPALIRSAGFRVVSLPVAHRPRVHGAPHYGVWDRLWIGLVDLAGVAWLARRRVPRDFREEKL